MMFTKKVAIVTLVGVGLLAISGWASASITVDGALDDWGVGIATGATNTVSGGNTYQGSPPNPIYGTSNYAGVITSSAGLAVATSIEDTNDLLNNYFIGPNQGGQNYDVEFLGTAIDSSYLYIAIMTGQRQDNGSSYFAPGDIRIGTDSGLFGLEVGGGVGGSSATDVSLGADGITYSLNSSGYTIGSTTPLLGDGANLQTAGSLWDTAATDWINDPINPPTPTQFQIGGGTFAGSAAAYIYQFTGLDAHAVIEAKIPLSLFGPDATVTSVDWSPSCGNDTLSVDVPSAPGGVPEPASVMVWCGLALVGLVAGKRRAV